jgi:uncharacterized protein (DUF2345 family)
MKQLALALLLVPSLAVADKTYNDAEAAIRHDCDKQGNATFNGADSKITVVGTCNRVVINGGGITATIANVDRIAINGAENTVALDAVKHVSVTGSSNKVTYKGKPKVSVTGLDNTVTEKR